MAQTKRKRKTKHRGNAAGMIESRGRTGRPPTAQERKAQAKMTAEQRRLERLERPPSWKASAQRAVFASLFFAVALILFFGQGIGPTVSLAAFMFFVYIPLGFYVDSFIYSRRMKRKARGA